MSPQDRKITDASLLLDVQQDCIRMRQALQTLVDAHTGSSHAVDGPVWPALQEARRVLEEQR